MSLGGRVFVFSCRLYLKHFILTFCLILHWRYLFRLRVVWDRLLRQQSYISPQLTSRLSSIRYPKLNVKESCQIVPCCRIGQKGINTRAGPALLSPSPVLPWNFLLSKAAIT